jgi:hypothetical protein
VAGNFLKLYLSKAYSIMEVKMISRSGPKKYIERMQNTEVKVYVTDSEDKETDVANCGKITGN